MSDVAVLNTNFTPIKGIPIGALMISAVLEEAGFQVDFYDYQTYVAERKPAIETFLSFLEEVECSILGLSVMANALPMVLGAVQRYKVRHPEAFIILGGPGPTDLPQEILEQFPVDVIVIGEGECTVVELMQTLENGDSLDQVAGICYRDRDQVRQTAPRARIRDLDKLPLPSYDKIAFADYPPGNAMILTSRGCPYRCSFCSAHSVWQRQITRRSPARVVEEILFVRERITGLEFHDDIFVTDPHWLAEFFDIMHAEGLSLVWRCNGRVNLMSQDLLRTMADHGCQEVFYGIESGSDHLLQKVCKGITGEQGRAVVDQTVKIIGRAVTSYIWGYPFESLDDFFQTILAVCDDEAKSGVRCQLGLLSPLPRSPLYQQYRHTISFSREIEPSVIFPGPNSLAAYPDLVDLIATCPRLFAPFYHYNHDSLADKLKVIKSLVV